MYLRSVPNVLAYAALLAWPVVALLAFARFRPTVAVLITFFGAMLLLPEKTDLKLPFQPVGKQEIASLAALLGVLLVSRARRRLLASKPLSGAELLIVLLMAGAFGTSRTNLEGLNYGMAKLPPLTDWEAISVCVGDVYLYLIPFVIGRALFTSRDDAVTLLRGFQIAAVCYVPFIVVEIVLSPQMHNWVYGFAQHDFIQTMRAGGYRPMVFMGHGLGLTLFLAAAVLAGVILTLARKPTIFRLRGRWLSIGLLTVLLACKSLGAAIFAIFFTLVLHFLLPRWQLRVLMVMAALVFLYPVSRATEVFPHKELVQVIKDTAGPDRAQSLEFRFTMEEYLSAHAAKKPVFGWGRFRRNMIFVIWREDPVSVSDGFWIVLYGVRGAWGFVAFFGLLVAPVFFLRARLRRVANVQDRYLLVGMTCMMMMYTIDLLPNGLFTNFPVFFAGALMGLIRGVSDPPPAPTITITAPAGPA